MFNLVSRVSERFECGLFFFVDWFSKLTKALQKLIEIDCCFAWLQSNSIFSVG
jgi:hypothetical protein